MPNPEERGPSPEEMGLKPEQMRTSEVGHTFEAADVIKLADVDREFGEGTSLRIEHALRTQIQDGLHNAQEGTIEWRSAVHNAGRYKELFGKGFWDEETSGRIRSDLEKRIGRNLAPFANGDRGAAAFDAADLRRLYPEARVGGILSNTHDMREALLNFINAHFKDAIDDQKSLERLRGGEVELSGDRDKIENKAVRDVRGEYRMAINAIAAYRLLYRSDPSDQEIIWEDMGKENKTQAFISEGRKVLRDTALQYLSEKNVDEKAGQVIALLHELSPETSAGVGNAK
ncbi:MAG: hypothetical protein A3A80_00500 [Candidatus Terrybacteria bacterium RIFCSPLOWO2_01_FULL_44_24]|uniref:Uncharacterized protein n=1 Tax=Candidatus Terrybacteria bacterium RIFCSPHIGHO2_01_FULL_43_35 TaxID=1802361 RepID=A0A1G2PDS4_9BACT|nr:MAG: hypothetical protein A2828_01480 [Candidatus Terrybacteria bacterium RIFCSPHIGHO2_01_FULL_43_35]OHA49612.1 MAG: hypothetical protein A3B75_00165 [Candidatus Terrybacteria bacterium RIFCSPHIGHO2_02_FULL_43_14]OHA51498.1 MAG: hypothetical protein A3A80_00500 [Candidatus Terrybacteria bacterium RIFCSPLOWO2_01_FULL_44_24]